MKKFVVVKGENAPKVTCRDGSDYAENLAATISAKIAPWATGDQAFQIMCANTHMDERDTYRFRVVAA